MMMRMMQMMMLVMLLLLVMMSIMRMQMMTMTMMSQLYINLMERGSVDLTVHLTWRLNSLKFAVTLIEVSECRGAHTSQLTLC